MVPARADEDARRAAPAGEIRMRNQSIAILSAFAAMLAAGSAGATVLVTACDTVVPPGETGMLTGDVTCAGAGVGVDLGSNATLDLAGHTLTLTGTAVAVQCHPHRCTITGGGGGGTIRTEEVAIDGQDTRVVIRDVTVDITPNAAGANAIQAGAHGSIDAANVRVMGDVGLRSISGIRIKAVNVDVSGTYSGIFAHRTLKGSDITANDTDNFGVYARRARIERLEAHGNAFAGFLGGKVKLVDSDLTGNGILLGDGIDLNTERSPRLENTTCGKSHKVDQPLE